MPLVLHKPQIWKELLLDGGGPTWRKEPPTLPPGFWPQWKYTVTWDLFLFRMWIKLLHVRWWVGSCQESEYIRLQTATFRETAIPQSHCTWYILLRNEIRNKHLISSAAWRNQHRTIHVIRNVKLRTLYITSRLAYRSQRSKKVPYHNQHTLMNKLIKGRLVSVPTLPTVRLQ